jgi:inhibitor of Bruton tyrosine kinase
MGANMQMMDKEDFTPLDLIMKSLPPIVASTNSGPSEAYVWGTNANFNLGIGNQQSKAVPEPVEFLRRNNICIKTVNLSLRILLPV